jgi:phosphotransferase system enzyme I (PtsP)
VDLGEITEAMTGWLSDPQTDLRKNLQEWAAERGIETD